MTRPHPADHLLVVGRPPVRHVARFCRPVADPVRHHRSVLDSVVLLVGSFLDYDQDLRCSVQDPDSFLLADHSRLVVLLPLAEGQTDFVLQVQLDSLVCCSAVRVADPFVPDSAAALLVSRFQSHSFRFE